MHATVDLTELTAVVREAVLDALRSRPVAREALTLREAARALGVDRSRVLAPAVARGDVRAVKVNGVTRIPRSEVERVAETGLARPGERRSGRRAAPRARAGAGARIRAIALDEL